MDFIRLGNWDLRPPFVLLGIEADMAGLTGQPDGTYDGPAPGSRILKLTRPFQRGGDVRVLQLALSAITVGRHVRADGIFGPVTDDAVRTLQDTLGLPATGEAGARTFELLAL